MQGEWPDACIKSLEPLTVVWSVFPAHLHLSALFRFSFLCFILKLLRVCPELSLSHESSSDN